MAAAANAARVLFVDDDALTRRAFARTMGARGFNVETAASGAEALSLAQRSFFRLVVTDLRMPGMDGLELVAQLEPTHPHTAFVVVTGVPEIDLRREHRAAGAVHSIVSKPWDEEHLTHTMNRAIELRCRSAGEPQPALDTEAARRILLVEDNPSDAYLVRRSLEAGSRPYFVDHVERLDLALGRVRENDYAIILSDLSLPDALGVDCVDHLCRAAPNTGLIVLSGLDDEETAIQAVQLGAQDYLVKDQIDRPSLLRALRYAMERKRTQQRLAYLAHFDQLTGLANRAHFVERLGQALRHAQRTRGTCTVMFIDLDRFKSINDSLGHDVGDSLLQAVAERLGRSVSGEATVGRLGGDEFAILLEDEDQGEPISDVCERILVHMQDPFELGGHRVSVSASIGVASHPRAGDTTRDLLRAADEAMYRAKRSGRACFDVFCESSEQLGLPRLLLEQKVREAVEADEFRLHYQPLVQLRERRIASFEALLRWSSDGAPVSPGVFVPILEDTGLIMEVGANVVRQACAQLRKWMDEGLVDARVAVNLSARQFENDTVISVIEESLRKHRLVPGSLEIEITESILMKDVGRANNLLSRMKALGVRIAIDDFGTGYSSLAYLHRFEIDTLKIDRSFIRAFDGGDKGGEAIADAVLMLGRRLGLEVVAEGVETQAQLDKLIEQGCDIIQGYYFARPAASWSLDELREVIQKLDNCGERAA